MLNTILGSRKFKEYFTSKNYGYYKTLAVNSNNGLNLSGIFNNKDAIVPLK